MKIKEIRLKNWRNHKDSRIALGDVNVFYGLNWSGKSSILNAVETVLVGENEWTGQEKLQKGISGGAESAILTLVGKNEVSRAIKQSGTGMKVNEESLTEAELLKSLKVTKRMVSATFRADGFMRMKPEEKMQILLDLLGAELTGALIAKRVREFAVKNGYCTEGDNLDIAVISQDETQYGIDVFDKISKLATERRREWGREQDKVKQLIKALDEKIESSAAVRFSELEEKTLSDLKKQRDEMLYQQGKMAEVERVLAERKELKTVLQNAQKTGDFERIDELRNHMKEQQKAASEFLEKGTKLKQGIESLQKEIDGLEVQFVKIEDGGRFDCPVFACVCPKPDLADMKEKLGKQIKMLAAKMEKASDEKDRILSEWQAANKVIEKLQARIREAETVVSKTNGQTMSQVEAAIADAEKELEKVRKSVHSMHDLEERIRKFEEIREKSGRIYDLQQELKKRRQEFEAAEIGWKLQDAVEKATNKTGVRAELVKEKIGSVKEILQETISGLTGGSCDGEVSLEEDFNVALVQDGAKISYSCLSSSQQKIIDISVQIALASISGLKMLCIDELELFDNRLKNWFEKTISGLVGREKLDVILIAVRIPERQYTWSRLKIEGKKEFMVENGTVMLLDSGSQAPSMAKLETDNGVIPGEETSEERRLREAHVDKELTGMGF